MGILHDSEHYFCERPRTMRNPGGVVPVARRLVATIAVGSALVSAATPALASDVNVRIYGTVVPFGEFVGTSNATAAGSTSATDLVDSATFTGLGQPGRFRMTQGTSNLGFGGSAKISNSLEVVWQIESAIPLDGDLVANTLATRNSRVGLTGPWGTVFMGIWDSPYKWASLPMINPLRAGFVPDYNAVMNNPGFGVPALNLRPAFVGGPAGPGPVTKSNASFYRRDANSIQYWSPKFFGLSLRLSYSFNEAKTAYTAANDPDPAVDSISPDILSGLLSYDHGPLRLRYAIELHRDYFGLSHMLGSALTESSNDVGQQVVASYTVTISDSIRTRIVGNADYLSYANSASPTGAVKGYSRAAFYALIDQSFGAHHVWGAYGQALAGVCELSGGADCSTDGLGARQMTLGYLYRANEVTDLYAVAYRVENEKSSRYGTFPPGPPAPALGATTQAFGIGMLYRFSADHVLGEK